jgi:lipoprotein-anchoring transpeptidase ErfK/SrfK
VDYTLTEKDAREHYGIHGTPEPSKIGKTECHGCIRLTNWGTPRSCRAW